MKKNKYIILVVALLLKSVVAISQNSTNEIVIVNNFVKTVFYEKYTAKSIADKYITFLPTDNTKYTIDDRIKILERHLKQIKKEKQPLLDKANYSVVSYDDYKGSKVSFSKGTGGIFILVSKDNPVMYFSLENERIVSFDYIRKGDEGFFITY